MTTSSYFPCIMLLFVLVTTMTYTRVGACIVENVCNTTRHKDLCMKSLKEAGASGSNDPKKILKLSFKVTKEQIIKGINESAVIQEAKQEPRSAEALETCREVMEYAVNDLERTMDSVSDMNIECMDAFVEDLRIWMSGVITYQEVCFDAFKNIRTETGRKIRQFFNESRALSSNALTIVTDIKQFLGKYKDVGSTLSGLLEGETGSTKGATSGSTEGAAAGSTEGAAAGSTEGAAAGSTGGAEGSKEGAAAGSTEGAATGSTQEVAAAGSTEGAAMGSTQEVAAGSTGGAEGSTSRRLLGSNGGFIAGQAPAWVNNPKRRVMGVPVGTIKPDAVVAQDGSGQYKTLKEALAKVPLNSMEPFIIYLKAGIYKEYNIIAKQAWNLILIGDGPTRTVIRGGKSFSKGVGTYHTAPLGVDGDGFMARDIKFENTAGPKGHQAVAIRVASDLSVFHNCVFDGAQDTLYAMRGRQFYRDCTIAGTVDYTFGDAQAVFQNCQFIVNKPGPGQDCLVTAQGRIEPDGPGGYVLQGCRIIGSPAYKAFQPQNKGRSSYLGRPWKPYSRTIVMTSFIDDIISPDGWAKWEGENFDQTAVYGEFANTGPGADISRRVKWPHAKQLSPEEADKYTPAKLFLNANEWIPNTGVPFAAGAFSAK